MKRTIVIALAAVALSGFGIACDAPTSTGGGVLAATGDPVVTIDPVVPKVEGRVHNGGTRPYTGIVTVTLFDDAGKIVGVYQGAVNSVPPGEDVTYTAIGTAKPAAWARVEAKVGSQLPG